VHDRGQI